MHSAWLNSTFLRVLKFIQIKDGRRNFKGEPILEKVWIIGSSLLYFNFKSFMDQNFLSFSRFQCILYDLVVVFSDSWNFYKLKMGGPNWWGYSILHKVWIIWSPVLYFNFKIFLDSKSSTFIRFQCILHDWGILFLQSWNSYKLKRGTNFVETLNYLVPHSVFQF